jgi:hypothetical protein
MHLFSCSCSGLPHLEVATCVYFAACLPCLYDASRCCCLLYSASSKKKQEARLPRAAAGAGGCTAAPAGLALLSAALALPYLLFTAVLLGPSCCGRMHAAACTAAAAWVGPYMSRYGMYAAQPAAARHYWQQPAAASSQQQPASSSAAVDRRRPDSASDRHCAITTAARVLHNLCPALRVPAPPACLIVLVCSSAPRFQRDSARVAAAWSPLLFAGRA